jgi:hypothetical protein
MRLWSRRSAAFMPLQRGSRFDTWKRLVVRALKRAEARAPFAPRPLLNCLVPLREKYYREEFRRRKKPRSKAPTPNKVEPLGSGIGWLENWMSSKYRELFPTLLVKVENVSCAGLPANADMSPASRPPEIGTRGILIPFKVTAAAFS